MNDMYDMDESGDIEDTPINSIHNICTTEIKEKLLNLIDYHNEEK